MRGDIDLSGYVFTQDEWFELDEDLRLELLRSAAETVNEPGFEPLRAEA